MKKQDISPFEEIVKICEKADKADSTLKDVKKKAENVVIRHKFEKEYGLVLDDSARLSEYDYYKKSSYESISFYKDGYKCHKEGNGRSVAWSEDGKQPVDEWVYSIGFSTGAYMFGDDYEGQKKLFQRFFEELRTYKPDYEDLHNNYLYWKVKNAKDIYTNFNEVLKKYRELNQSELESRKIAKLKEEITKLEANK